MSQSVKLFFTEDEHKELVNVAKSLNITVEELILKRIRDQMAFDKESGVIKCKCEGDV